MLSGFSLADACRALSPWIGHLHFSDSTGTPATFPLTHEGERAFFGVGDMHAPPGMGSIDFEALAATLEPRTGTRLVIEVKRHFLVHAEHETLVAARRFAAALDRPPA